MKGSCHLNPLEPHRGLIAHPYPAGVIRHPETCPCQIDAELSWIRKTVKHETFVTMLLTLGAVSQAVAVARLSIRHHCPVNLSGKGEVICWRQKWSVLKSHPNILLTLRFIESDVMFRLILVHTDIPTLGELSFTQGHESLVALLGQVSGDNSLIPNTW